jgi:hypothetical protein
MPIAVARTRREAGKGHEGEDANELDGTPDDRGDDRDERQYA